MFGAVVCYQELSHPLILLQSLMVPKTVAPQEYLRVIAATGGNQQNLPPLLPMVFVAMELRIQALLYNP